MKNIYSLNLPLSNFHHICVNHSIVRYTIYQLVQRLKKRCRLQQGPTIYHLLNTNSNSTKGEESCTAHQLRWKSEKLNLKANVEWVQDTVCSSPNHVFWLLHGFLKPSPPTILPPASSPLCLLDLFVRSIRRGLQLSVIFITFYNNFPVFSHFNQCRRGNSGGSNITPGLWLLVQMPSSASGCSCFIPLGESQAAIFNNKLYTCQNISDRVVAG